MDSFERFQRDRSVIEDFTSRTLVAIPSVFGRLYYIGSLKDSATGRYRHDGLAEMYSESSVQEALEQCHEELFSRILETPLCDQERDLRNCLAYADNRFWTVVEAWREDGSLRTMCPEGLPNYLNELFCSNLGALFAIFSAQKVTLDSAA